MTDHALSLLAESPRLPLLARVAVQFARVVTQWDHNYRSRQHLARLDDHALRDIGRTRDEAMTEARRSVWHL